MIEPASSNTEGFHLFIEPAGSLAEELGMMISNLAKEYGGPVFKPHVTLLARMPTEPDSEVVRKAQEVANMLTPFTLTLGELATEQAYFRALYTQMREKEEMDKRHKQASSIFSMEPSTNYRAHLSLLYGNYPEERKAETIKSLIVPTGSFLVDRIHLYRTEGPTEAWEKLQEFMLAG